MAAQEISFSVQWTVWIPIGIAVISLFLTTMQMRKKNTLEDMNKLERKIDRALNALKECEDNLKHCGRELETLRREKFTLLEQIAAMAKAGPSSNASEPAQ